MNISFKKQLFSVLLVCSSCTVFFPGIVLARLPNDELWTQDSSMPLLKLPDAWEYTTGTSDVVVAVIDTGVDITNPDLIENIWTNPQEKADGLDNDSNGFVDDIHGWNFIDNTNDVRPQISDKATRIGLNHGTVVAGILGAVGNNGIGSSGVNWRVKIMPLKILDEHGDGDSDLAVKAIDYAIAKKASIINLSFVGPTPSLNFIQAIRRAYRAGILVVAAAGNAPESGKGTNLNSTPQYPVCFDDPLKEENWVVGVAALNDVGVLASFSNFGDKCVDLAAPGSHISSTVYYDPTKGYTDVFGGLWSGTSIAAPFVSGVAALAKSLQPLWGPDELRKALVENTDPIPGNDSHAAGRGSLNALKVVKYAAQGGNGGLPSGVFLNVTQTGATTGIKIVDSAFKDSKSFVITSKRLAGSINVVSADLDGSGIATILATVPDSQGTLIKIFQRDGKLIREFRPFGKNSKGALSIMGGDLEKNGHDDLLIGDAATQMVTVLRPDGTQLLKIHVPEHGESMQVTMIREGNDTFIVTAVKHGVDTTLYVWDQYGSFVRSFVAHSVGTGTLGVTDLKGNGHDVLYFGTQQDTAVDVATYSIDGVQHEHILANTIPGRIIGFTFAHVHGQDINQLVVASQKGKFISYNVIDTDGQRVSSSSVLLSNAQIARSMYFGR